MPAKSKWTILTYIAAHNNLDALGKRSLHQIMQVGSTPDVVQGVLFDGTHGAARYIAGGPGLILQEEQLQNYDSGDPVRLIETAKWIFEKCPAERYGVILWSHGSGWQPAEIQEVARQARGDQVVTAIESTERAAAPGSLALFRSTLVEILKKPSPPERAICFDDGTGHSLDTLELEQVAKQISDSIQQPLDFLGMDACLMATLEVAYQLRRSVQYLVASEELVPGYSWPYDTIFGALRANPGCTAQDLAAWVVRDYVEYYTQNPPGMVRRDTDKGALDSSSLEAVEAGGDVTLVALDLSKINTLVSAADQLAQSLAADMNTQANALWQAQRAALDKETKHNRRSNNKFLFHLWDLATLASRLYESAGATTAVKQAAEAVTNAVKPGGAVIAEGHRGEWFDGIGGVSIYLVPPGGDRRISPYYPDLALSKDTHWDEMLKTYFEVLE